MSEQRIDTGADAATGRDADPAESAGIADPSRTGTAGGDADMPQPGADRRPEASGDEADTEGVAGLQDAQARADRARRGDTDLGGREPDDGSPAGGTAAIDAPYERKARAETGEVSAPPSPERREEEPGTIATEFGDRADSAPEDDIARPQI